MQQTTLSDVHDVNDITNTFVVASFVAFIFASIKWVQTTLIYRLKRQRTSCARRIVSNIIVTPIDEVVTPAEAQRLYARFQKLDREQSGFLKCEDMLSIPELAMNPLALKVCVVSTHAQSRQIISRFDEKKEDRINFRQFIKTLSVFCVRAPREDKLGCMHHSLLVDNHK